MTVRAANRTTRPALCAGSAVQADVKRGLAKAQEKAEQRKTIEPLLLDYAGAEAALALGRRTLERMVALGQIPGVRRVGRRTLFCRRTLIDWIARGCPPHNDRMKALRARG